MTGASLAWFLRRLGRDVVLLESETIASKASGRNAGFVITGLGEHYAGAIELHGRDRARTIWRVNHENVDLVERIVREAGIDCGFQRRGSLTLAASEKEWDLLQASARLAADDGFPGELVEPEDVEKRLSSKGFFGGLLQPRDGEIQPARFVRGLVRAAEREGVRVFEGTPVRAVELAGGGIAVRTDRCGVIADRVVIAANAHARSLHPFLARHTFPVRAQVLATDALDHPGFDLPVYCDYGYAYWRGFQQRAIMGGQRPMDHTAEYTDEDALNPSIQEGLEAFMREHFPGIRHRVSHRWSGVMCFSADGLPIIGEIPGEEKVFFSGAYTGHGFGYAQTAARWLADLLLHGTDAVPAIFRPARVFDERKRPA